MGQGTIDFRRIFARREQAGIRHFFVEHDEPADPLAVAGRAIEYLQGAESSECRRVSRRALAAQRRWRRGRHSALPAAAVPLPVGTVTASPAPQAVRLPLALPRDPAARLRRAAKADGARRRSICCSRRSGPVVRELGLVCSMGYPTERRRLHRAPASTTGRTTPCCCRSWSDAFRWRRGRGVPNVIAMFGNRQGQERRGRRSTTASPGSGGSRRSRRSTASPICVELLNSKVDHKDYQGDRTAFGVAGHARRGLAPGEAALRHLPHADHGRRRDPHHPRPHRATSPTSTPAACPAATSWTRPRSSTTRAVARAIADTGFTGYVAHEFMPTRDPLTSLREAVAVCQV